MPFPNDEEDAPTPAPKPAGLSDDDQLAMALIALASTGIGGLVGGRTGAMGGAVAGGKGAGMIAQDAVDKEKKAEEIAETAKAQEAASKRRVSEGVEIATETAKLKPEPVTVTKNASGQVITVNPKDNTSVIVDPTKEVPKPGSAGDDNAPTIGQKAVDRDYAKHYNEFSGKGRVNATQTIKQLEALKAELDAEAVGGGAGGGRFVNMLPDNVRSDKAIKFKTEIPGKANLVLKDLFGGQLSDAERKSESQTYYNDLLGPKENSELLAKKIETMKQQLASETRRAAWFQEHKTLAGYDSTAGASGEWTDDGTDAKISAFMAKNGIKDRAKAIEILKENGKI